MKLFIYILPFLFLNCNAQTTYKAYKFSSIGWTVSVPSDLEIIDSLTLKQWNSNGDKLAQKASGTEAEIEAPNTLISLQKGLGNDFISNTTPFDTTKDGNWKDHFQFSKELLYKMFQTATQNIDNVQIDTSSSFELIDNKLFNKFNVKIVVPNRKDINMDVFGILRNGYDFGITIVSQDESIRQRFLGILKTSKFD